MGRITTDKLIRRKKYQTSSYWGEVTWSLIRAVLILGIGFIIVYPLLIKLSSSIMTESDMYDLTIKWIPRRLDFRSVVRNYRDLWTFMNYPVALRNSIGL